MLVLTLISVSITELQRERETFSGMCGNERGYQSRFGVRDMEWWSI